jgi:hypothetical protein
MKQIIGKLIVDKDTEFSSDVRFVFKNNIKLPHNKKEQKNKKSSRYEKNENDYVLNIYHIEDVIISKNGNIQAEKENGWYWLGDEKNVYKLYMETI